MAEINHSNGWNEWAKYVLKTLEEVKKHQTSTEDALHTLTTSIEVLKTKISIRAGTTGAITGFLTAIAVAIYFIIKLNDGA